MVLICTQTSIVCPKAASQLGEILLQLVNVVELSHGYSDKGAKLNGINQWVEFGSHQDRCFGNLSYCNHGFAFAFWVMFGSKPDNPDICQFLFTSGDKANR